MMECGYDLGDCGLSNYEKLFLFFPFANGTIHTLPPGRHVGYFKLDKVGTFYEEYYWAAKIG